MINNDGDNIGESKWILKICYKINLIRLNTPWIDFIPVKLGGIFAILYSVN